jgi:ribonuclease BN (tRNA processing enzyme)
MNPRSVLQVICLIVGLIGTGHAADPACGVEGVRLQVLGSGGPELTDGRASSGYLLWQDGRARILIDIGAGSMLRYEHSGARVEDIDVILLTHLHVDHSADLPALIKASFFSDRDTNLPLYGPTGNGLMPGSEVFVASLIGEEGGAYRYLSGYLTGSEAYRLRAHDVPATGRTIRTVIESDRFRIRAAPVHHGPVPALAWRIDIGGRAVVISGDMNGDKHTVEELAAGADLLVAHHAIPEGMQGVARNLHMPPSVIGEIAAVAKVKQLVLSHRMNRTIGQEMASERFIRKHYAGPLAFAEDGDCF